MNQSLLTIVVLTGLLGFAPGCSSSVPNTVNEPAEVKTLEQQLQSDKERAEKDAADFAEQAGQD